MLKRDLGEGLTINIFFFLGLGRNEFCTFLHLRIREEEEKKNTKSLRSDWLKGKF